MVKQGETIRSRGAKKIAQKIIKVHNSYWEHWSKIHLVYIPLIIFITIGVLVMIYSFRNMRQNNTDLTNVSFAMFVTLASASFSYAKTYDRNKEKDRPRINKIISAGETSMQAAIFFLFSSALKYINLRLIHIFPKGFVLSAIYWLIYATYFLCFILAFYFAIFAVFYLNTILIKRFHEPKEL